MAGKKGKKKTNQKLKNVPKRRKHLHTNYTLTFKQRIFLKKLPNGLKKVVLKNNFLRANEVQIFSLFLGWAVLAISFFRFFFFFFFFFPSFLFSFLSIRMRNMLAVLVMCVVWCSGLVLDSVGEKPSLSLLANGNPAVLYQRNSSLVFLRALDGNGASWDFASRQEVLLGANVSSRNIGRSLSLVSGNPAFCAARLNGTKAELVFRRSLDAIGSTWGSILLLKSDGSNNEGEFCSLLTISNLPVIAFFEGAVGRLGLVKSADSLGSEWNAPLVLLLGYNSGEFLSVSLLGAFPMFASSFITTGTDIRYTHALENDTSLQAFELFGPVFQLSPAQTEVAPCILNVQGRPAIFFPTSPSGWQFAVSVPFFLCSLLMFFAFGSSSAPTIGSSSPVDTTL
jgi:hypothetical protein